MLIIEDILDNLLDTFPMKVFDFIVLRYGVKLIFVVVY